MLLSRHPVPFQQNLTLDGFRGHRITTPLVECIQPSTSNSGCTPITGRSPYLFIYFIRLFFYLQTNVLPLCLNKHHINLRCRFAELPYEQNFCKTAFHPPFRMYEQPHAWYQATNAMLSFVFPPCILWSKSHSFFTTGSFLQWRFGRIRRRDFFLNIFRYNVYSTSALDGLLFSLIKNIVQYWHSSFEIKGFLVSQVWWNTQ